MNSRLNSAITNKRLNSKKPRILEKPNITLSYNLNNVYNTQYSVSGTAYISNPLNPEEDTQTPLSNVYSGFTITKISKPSLDPIDNYTYVPNSSISSQGNRLWLDPSGNNTNTLYGIPHFNETITIHIRRGHVVASATYPDNGTDYKTDDPVVGVQKQIDFLVLNGSGIFRNIKKLRFLYQPNGYRTITLIRNNIP